MYHQRLVNTSSHVYLKANLTAYPEYGQSNTPLVMKRMVRLLQVKLLKKKAELQQEWKPRTSQSDSGSATKPLVTRGDDLVSSTK